MDDMPQEFLEHQFKTYVRYTTGSAIIGAQYVERVFNGICLILDIESLPFDLYDFNSGDSSRMRQTLGAMKQRIADTDFFSDSFIARMSEFVRRRNRVVHGLFSDTFSSREQIQPTCDVAKKYVAECEWVSREAANLVETGFGIYAELADRGIRTDEQLRRLVEEFAEFRDLGTAALK